jgi:hypothetical protein
MALTRVPTTEDGKIARANGRPRDGSYPLLVVIAVPCEAQQLAGQHPQQLRI